jgi:hypothetical protein
MTTPSPTRLDLELLDLFAAACLEYRLALDVPGDPAELAELQCRYHALRRFFAPWLE